MEYVSRNPKSTAQPLQGTGVWDGGSQTPKTPCHVQPGGHNQTPPRQTQSDQLQRIRTNWTVQTKKKAQRKISLHIFIHYYNLAIPLPTTKKILKLLLQ